MAPDVFAKIGVIKGESLDSKHKDEIEVLSWAWGVTQSGSLSQGGGGGAGKASFNDFAFTHHVDKASPLLMKACATGQHIPEATVTARKAGKVHHEYLVIKLTDVIVTGVTPSGDEQATLKPSELRNGDVGGFCERRHWILVRSDGGTSASVACSLSCSARM